MPRLDHDLPHVISLAEATRRVLQALEADPNSSPVLAAEITRMSRSIGHRGAILLDDVTDELLMEYVCEVAYLGGDARDPSSSTMRRRRWAVKVFFQQARALRLTDRAVGVDLGLPGRSGLLTRPLTDAEVWRCEQAALMTLFETRAPTVLALAEAGGDIGEIAMVTVGDIDLADGTVRYTGHAGHAARVNGLTEWGLEEVARHIRRLGPATPETPLVIHSDTSRKSATASISTTLGDILRLAHVAGPRVKPRSVRAWSALRVWENSSNPIPVAHWLGLASLDTAMATIGLDWRPR